MALNCIFNARNSPLTSYYLQNHKIVSDIVRKLAYDTRKKNLSNS